MPSIFDCFPFNTFRPNQKKILTDAKKSLEAGTEVIIIDGPTGFGKSPVNIALGRYFAPTFYTTPQKNLVNQIIRDFGPKQLAIDGGVSKDIMGLLGRKNYICRLSKQPSDECYLRKIKSLRDLEEQIFEKCSEQPNCTYWIQKRACMNASIVVLTFAMLITNRYLSFNCPDASFSKRKLLIIDEAHSLEDQIASMFTGFTINSESFPKELKNEIWKKLELLIPHEEQFNDKHILFLEKVKEFCLSSRPYCDKEKDLEKLDVLYRKIDYLFEEIKELERKWVVNIERESNTLNLSLHYKPILVDRFLQKKIWSQAKQIVLSSATIPFRDNPKEWLDRLGLGNKRFSFHSAPMTFPVAHRPIILSTISGKMTREEEKKNWSKNISTLKTILKHHSNDKGVIHTHSYVRAKRVAKALKDFDMFLHNKEEIDEDVIIDWINSKKKILISPTISQGVDLKDDLCRFQILFKVPYPYLGDARVKYLLNSLNQKRWYYDETAISIVQMYGRAVRSQDDYAIFYILDGSFYDLLEKCSFPSWFLDAFQKKYSFLKKTISPTKEKTTQI